MPRKIPTKWIEISIEKSQEKEKMELIRFWKEFYNKYLEMDKNGTQDEEKTKSFLSLATSWKLLQRQQQRSLPPFWLPCLVPFLAYRVT